MLESWRVFSTALSLVFSGLLWPIRHIAFPSRHVRGCGSASRFAPKAGRAVSRQLTSECVTPARGTDADYEPCTKRLVMSGGLSGDRRRRGGHRTARRASGLVTDDGCVARVDVIVLPRKLTSHTLPRPMQLTGHATASGSARTVRITLKPSQYLDFRTSL